jgi:hypothetical protein
MAFRDELEASRARIDALDAELARLKRAKAAAAIDTPPFAILSVILFFGVVALLVGVAFQWDRAEAAAAEARRWRQLEGETAVELEELRHRSREEERGDRPAVADGSARVAWFLPDDTRAESWRAAVSEHIGAAPVALGQICSAHLEHVSRASTHESSESCRLRVTCDDELLYPRDGETDVVQCRLDPDDRITSLGRADPTGTRAVGTSEALRMDDGPNGTWSLLLRRLR